jgi:hypothetical protein
MTIMQAVGIARTSLVEGGGLGPSGELGRIYLKVAHELSKLGVGVLEEISNEVYNEAGKFEEYVAGLKAKNAPETAPAGAGGENPPAPALDAGAVQLPASGANAEAGAALDSSTGPSFN